MPSDTPPPLELPSGAKRINRAVPGPFSAGGNTVTATVVDAVGLLAVSGKQSVSTSGGVGPSGLVNPNVDPAKQDFDIAGNADDPINARH